MAANLEQAVEAEIRFPDEVVKILRQPIDPKALTAAPRGLTSIKSIYITERLNDAFGLGRWFIHDEIVEVQRPQSTVDRDGNEKTQPPMVIVKAHLELLDYAWFRAASYGGNNNPDLGDAYKGAVSDAISKIGAIYLGIAVDVYKGLSFEQPKQEVARQSAPRAEQATTPKPNGQTNGHSNGHVKGPNDAEGSNAVSEGKAKRFIAIALSTNKSRDEIGEALAQEGLSDIKYCPWKGKTYEKLCEWAAR